MRELKMEPALVGVKSRETFVKQKIVALFQPLKRQKNLSKLFL